MPRKLTPRAAVALAELRVLRDDPLLVWAEVHPVNRKLELADATVFLRHLRDLGFDAVPRKTTRVKRKAGR